MYFTIPTKLPLDALGRIFMRHGIVTGASFKQRYDVIAVQRSNCHFSIYFSHPTHSLELFSVSVCSVLCGGKFTAKIGSRFQLMYC